MWEKPAHQTATASARPLRVAYLVELSDCADQLLDAVFAESYSRWGGRRTLIVPATEGGIDPRYADWLFYFDPDVIYSFVALNDDAVAAIHERYAPAYLVKHEELGVRSGEPPQYQIRLPIEGLSSLSVLPAFLSRNWGFEGRPQRPTILSKHWDRSESQFLEENFGFLSRSFSSGAVATSFPELFTCLTLISPESFANPRDWKDSRADYRTDETTIVDALADRSPLLALVNLSEMFAPFMSTAYWGGGGEGMNIVAGDTPADRLLFWNGHHKFARPSFHCITSLRLPASKLEDPAFITQVSGLIARRGPQRASGHSDSVTLRSCSLPSEVLEAAAALLRTAGRWIAVRVEVNADHTSSIPSFSERQEVYFTHGGVFGEPEGKASTEFQGNRFSVPRAMPWHMSEALPPQGLRSGNWMIDLAVERHVDHCRYSNRRHVWSLPRRLRLERAFSLDREPDRTQDYLEKVLRPMRNGMIGLPLNADVHGAVLSTPQDDTAALQLAISNEIEWHPFDRSRQSAPQGRQRFGFSEISDKGRYLLGVLQLFDSLPDAFEVLMDGFWRDLLQDLGASRVEDRPDVTTQFLTILRRRLRQDSGPLHFESDDELNRLAREALRVAGMFRKARAYVTYGKLKERWDATIEKWLAQHPKQQAGDDDTYYRDEARLARSVQYLCRREVLFQGREWLCRTCFNRNWVGIDALGRDMTCEVCGRREAAPVSGDWHFRANSFLTNAYREHGTEALLWALWQLSDRARESFYFVPSLNLWFRYPSSEQQRHDLEVDGVVVVDGRVYMVEATTSATLTDEEVRRLALAAERIRPNALFIACMGASAGTLTHLKERTIEMLPDGVLAEVAAFDPNVLDRGPFLAA